MQSQIREATVRYFQILLVENHRTWKRILHRALQKSLDSIKCPGRIESIDNFTDALIAISERGPWDLLVTDIDLEEEVGVQDTFGMDLVRCAYEHDIPSIVVSESKKLTLRQQAVLFREYKLRDFIYKPDYYAQLVPAVCRIVNETMQTEPSAGKHQKNVAPPILQPDKQEETGMSQDQQHIYPAETVPNAQTGRKHLLKGLVLELPLVGKLINEMVFETAKSDTDAQNKSVLSDVLNQIQQHQQAQETDLGDLLLRLEQQENLAQEIRDAVVSLTLYLRGEANAETVSVVEHAVERVLPGFILDENAKNATGQRSLNRFTLSQEMQHQLTSTHLDVLLGDMPGAKDYVPVNAGKIAKIDALLDWTESIEGPKLNGLLAIIQRRYPQFMAEP